MRLAWLLLLPSFSTGLFGQGAASVLSGSTVSGRVFCNDTNAPARFAQVVLEPARAIDSYSETTSKGVTAHMSGAETLPDGSFAIPHVASGTYYVFVSESGYVSPLAALGVSRDDLQKPSKELKQEIAQLVPQVTVQANLPATVNVTLLRGAAVSGTVLYDDGSPATGLGVKLLVQQKDQWVTPQNGPVQGDESTTTDDRGVYRFSGLPAGKYLAVADLSISQTSYDVSPNGYGMSSNGNYSIPVYSGNAMRTRDAAPFDLKLGDEHSDEDIEIPLTKLHDVSGAVTAQRDGHVVNSATVTLLHADDHTQEATTEVAPGATGWALHYVPEGDYILRVSGAADDQFEETANPPGTTPSTTVKSHVLHSYGPAEQPLHVGGDVSGLSVAVPELHPAVPPGSD